jgi:hypothetical protein
MIEERLAQLSQLEPGWFDGKKGIPPTEAALAQTRAFLAELPSAMPMAHISPMPEGSISIEWEISERFLQVELGPGDEAEWCTIDEADQAAGWRVLEGNITEDRPWLAWLIKGTPLPPEYVWREDDFLFHRVGRES